MLLRVLSHWSIKLGDFSVVLMDSLLLIDITLHILSMEAWKISSGVVRQHFLLFFFFLMFFELLWIVDFPFSVADNECGGVLCDEEEFSLSESESWVGAFKEEKAPCPSARLPWNMIEYNSWFGNPSCLIFSAVFLLFLRIPYEKPINFTTT